MNENKFDFYIYYYYFFFYSKIFYSFLYKNFLLLFFSSAPIATQKYHVMLERTKYGSQMEKKNTVRVFIS